MKTKLNPIHSNHQLQNIPFGKGVFKYLPNHSATFIVYDYIKPPNTMRYFKSPLITTCVIFIIAFFSSCEKKWKKPTTLEVGFKLETDSYSSLVRFNDGSIHLSDFHFSGTRKQGSPEVELEKTLSSASEVEFNTTYSGADFTLDVPQGTYTRVDFEFAADSDFTGASVVMEGIYINSLNDTLNVKFELAADENFVIRVQNPSGSDEIVFIEEIPKKATITLNPDYWFATISSSLLDNATITVIDDEDVILINEDENNGIYNLIVNRVKDGNKITVE